MPSKTVHCRVVEEGRECGKPIKGASFQERMAKLRRHRKDKHPGAHKRSVKKSQETRRLDPIRRRRLQSKPEVLSFKDYKGKGLIRVLHRADGTFFPEFAVYVKMEPSRHPYHGEHDAMLRKAGLIEEKGKPGKWVLRTNNFSIFAYV